MKAITVTYYGPTETSAAKYVARDLDNNRSAISANHGNDGYQLAARSLCNKMGWYGTLIGGCTKKGKVFVFTSSRDKFTV